MKNDKDREELKKEFYDKFFGDGVESIEASELWGWIKLLLSGIEKEQIDELKEAYLTGYEYAKERYGSYKVSSSVSTDLHDK